MKEEEAQAVLRRLKPSVFHDDAFDCQLIIEAATEKMDIKGRIFSELDRIAPANAILASNTNCCLDGQDSC